MKALVNSSRKENMQFKKRTKIKDLLEICGPLISEIQGDPEAEVLHFSSTKLPKEGGFAFVNSLKALESMDFKPLHALLLPLKFKEELPETPAHLNLLFSKNVDLAARQIKNQLVFQTPHRPLEGIHPTASIHETADIAEGVKIGPFSVIGAHTKIAKDCYIAPHVVIQEHVEIAENTTVQAFVFIGHHCVIGKNCDIQPHAIIGSEGFGYVHDHLGNHYRVPHTGRVVLEDDVHVGGATAIDRGTIDDSVIGRGTKLDNQCHLAHNTRVGKNGLITAQLVVAGSTTIGDNFACGGKTAITGHVNITDNVRCSGLTGVTKDITESGDYGGYPVVPLKDFFKTKATINQLPKLRKQMSKVMKKLFPEGLE